MAGKSGTAIKVLVVVAILAAAGYYTYDAMLPTARVAAARRGVAENIIYGNVRVTPDGGTRYLLSTYEGSVKKANLKADQPIRQGDPLVVLDTALVDFDLKDRRADLEALTKLGPVPAEMDRKTAKMRFDTAEAVRTTGGTYTENDMAAFKNAVDFADAAIEAQQAEREARRQKLATDIERLELKRTSMTILAPVDGIVTKPNVKANETIPAGFTVAEYISNDLLVQARISGDAYSKVRVGQEVRVSLNTYAGKVFRGKVSAIGKAPETETQKYVVDIELSDIPGEQLIAGLEGSAEILADQKPNAIVVPLGAVSGTRVRIVAGGRVQERAVQVGFETTSTVEIISGVAEGELVITDLAQSFHDGDRVKTEVVPAGAAR